MSRDKIAPREYAHRDGNQFTVSFAVDEARLAQLAARAYKNKTKRAIDGPLKACVERICKPDA